MSARVSLPEPLPAVLSSNGAESISREKREHGGAPAWPPPPHDPRERELAKRVGDWEIRLFGGRMFQYFVTRGFWHLQLWSPTARISVLSPSRLTCGFYEAYPVESWKARDRSYERIAMRLAREHGIALPDAATMRALEKGIVSDLVNAQGRPVS